MMESEGTGGRGWRSCSFWWDNTGEQAGCASIREWFFDEDEVD
jgi:hypothetical protein